MAVLKILQIWIVLNALKHTSWTVVIFWTIYLLLLINSSYCFLQIMGQEGFLLLGSALPLGIDYRVLVMDIGQGKIIYECDHNEFPVCTNQPKHSS